MKNSKGFTLAELIMVLIILSTIIFIVVPKMGAFLLSKVQLESTARRIAGIAKYAHTRATSTGKQNILHFDINKNIYWLEEISETEEDKEEKILLEEEDVGFSAPPDSYGRKNNLHEDVRIKDIALGEYEKKTSGIVEVKFLPEGYNKKWILHLKNKKNEAITLLANPLTGLVNIEDGYLEWK